MTSKLLKKAMGEKMFIISIGYWTHPEVSKICDKLKEYIGKKRFSCDVSGMVIVEIPHSKKNKIFEKFKEIKLKEKFWQCDGFWNDETTNERFNVKFHPQNVKNYGLPKSKGGEEE